MEQNEKETPSFRKKLGNTTYTVKVHFDEQSDKTFKDRVQRLVINDCMERKRKNKNIHSTP